MKIMLSSRACFWPSLLLSLSPWLSLSSSAWLWLFSWLSLSWLAWPWLSFIVAFVFAVALMVHSRCITKIHINHQYIYIVHILNYIMVLRMTSGFTIHKKQDKYTMDPGSQIDRSNQKIILSKKWFLKKNNTKPINYA